MDNKGELLNEVLTIIDLSDDKYNDSTTDVIYHVECVGFQGYGYIHYDGKMFKSYFNAVSYWKSLVKILAEEMREEFDINNISLEIFAENGKDLVYEESGGSVCLIEERLYV